MKAYPSRLLLVLLLLLSFPSCIRDNSSRGTKPIATIKFVGSLSDEVYRVDQWDELVLSAPEVTQEHIAKPLTYKWDIAYQTVSTHKELRYVCRELTPIDVPWVPCRLTVSNEDGSTWIDFRLKVTSPYEEGVVVLSHHNGQSCLSFKREDKGGGSFQKEAYRINNPQYPLGTLPRCLSIHDKYLYIGTENPTRVVKVNKSTFVASKLLRYPAQSIDYILTNDNNEYGINILYSGKVLEFDTSQDGFMNMYQQSLDAQYPGARLASKALRLRGGILLYDDVRGLFMKGSYAPEPLFTELFAPLSLIELLPCKGGEHALALLGEGSQAPLLLYLDPNLSEIFSRTSTQGTGISRDSRFVCEETYARLYYTVGNALYVYDYTSMGNFPSTPLLTVGEKGDVIEKLLLNDDETKLYVGYRTSDTPYPGAVLCLDLSTKEVLWDERGVAGQIVDMIYKK